MSQSSNTNLMEIFLQLVRIWELIPSIDSHIISPSRSWWEFGCWSKKKWMVRVWLLRKRIRTCFSFLQQKSSQDLVPKKPNSGGIFYPTMNTSGRSVSGCQNWNRRKYKIGKFKILKFIKYNTNTTRMKLNIL